MSSDLSFRPMSYSDLGDPVALALNGIMGQMRREMVRDMLTAEGEQREHYDAVLGPIQEDILEERADESFILNLSSAWGPSWMGGEYLPRPKSGEVEIARLVLRSTTMDVFSLRARWSGGRYHYRLLDEYQSTFRLCRKTSRRTLTLGQLIELLETVGSDDLDLGGNGIVRPWWNQQWEYDDDPEECVAFATVESDQYPGLADWYGERAEEWCAERWAERRAKEEPESFEGAIQGILEEMSAFADGLRISTGGGAMGYGLRKATIDSLSREMEPLAAACTADEALATLERLGLEQVLGGRREHEPAEGRGVAPQ